MNIVLNWFEPIELGSSSNLEANLDKLDLNQIPEISGVYVFFREYNQTQEPLYVGKTINMRSRMKQHFNSRSLVEGLKNTKQGAKKIIFAEIKTKGGASLETAINQAEKGLIQHYIDEGFELLNKKLMQDHFDYICPAGESIDMVNVEIAVYKTKPSK